MTPEEEIIFDEIMKEIREALNLKILLGYYPEYVSKRAIANIEYWNIQ